MQMEQLQIYSGFNYEMKREKDEIAWFPFLELLVVICAPRKREKSAKKRNPSENCFDQSTGN